MNARSLIIESGSTLIPTTRPFTPVNEVGPYKIGDLVPWRGMLLAVVGIVSNGSAFQLALAPQGLTSGYIKKSMGKKGKRHARSHV